MIGPFRHGAAAYLDQDLTSHGKGSSSTVQLYLSVRTVYRCEKIDAYSWWTSKSTGLQKKGGVGGGGLEIVCHPSVWREDKASHVVTAVSYGLDTYCVLELDVGGEDAIDPDDAMDILQEAADLMRNDLLVDDREDLGIPEVTESLKQIKVQLFADWNTSTSQPLRLSYPEAYHLILSSTTNSNASVIPVTVWLCPLVDVIKPVPLLAPYRPLSSGVVADCRRFFIQLKRIQAKVRQSAAHPYVDRKSLLKLETHLSNFHRMFQRLVSQIVRNIRTGRGPLVLEEEAHLSKIISAFMAKDSAFNPDLIDRWVDHHLFWMDMSDKIQKILPQVPFYVANDGKPLELDTSELVLIFKLPQVIRIIDSLLEDMDLFIRRNNNMTMMNRSLISCQTSSRVDLDDGILKLKLKEDWSRDIILSVRQLAQFIAENAADTKRVNYQFRIEGEAEPDFYVLHNGALERFVLPSPPDGLRVLDNQRGKVTLAWNMPPDWIHCRLTGFLIEYRFIDDSDDANQNIKWTRIGSTALAGQVQLDNLVHGKEYFFQVATATAVGRSKFSLPIGPVPISFVCHPPRNIVVNMMTDTIIRLSWEDPLHMEDDLKITAYEVEFWPDDELLRQTPRRYATQNKSAKLDNLLPGVTYNIRVLAVCGSVGSSPFSLAIQSTTQTEAERLALIVRKVSTLFIPKTNPVGNGNNKKMAIYDIPLRRTDVNGQNQTMRRFTFGYPNLNFKHKTILVVGATGAGKTTLINAMINYILGVEWDDDFRFRVVVEPELSQAHSQTNAITCYDLFHTKRSRLDYSLTIVDTPGFGDTRGMEQDNEIYEQIRRSFSQVGGIQQLEAVCFVVQSSLPRLTPTQHYIFDSILRIFGNDIQHNIRLMTTFADGQQPPVLAAITEARVPCPTTPDGLIPLFYKFNNSSIFAPKDGPDQQENMDSFNRLFFTMSLDQFQSFFHDLHQLPTTSLSLTKEVLHERKRLEVVVEGLEQRIHVGLVKLEEFKQMKDALTRHQDEMAANQEFQFEVEYTVPQQTDISGTGHWISNCQKCQWTCHYPCESPNDKDRYKCFAMDENGYCKICPGQCFYTEHYNQKFKWEQKVVKVNKSFEDVRLKYQTAKDHSATVQDVLDRMSQELVEFEKELMRFVDIAHPLIARLNEIALRPHPFSAPDYIDLIIKAEEQEHRPGYLDRIETLRKLRQMAVITSKLITKQKVFDSNPQ